MANKSARNASSGKAPRKTPVPPGARRAEHKAATAQPHSEGEVDRTLKETFPASDAPVWGGSEAERQRRIRKAQAREQSAATPAQEGRLRGKTFAILATHGFEQSELMEPRRALQAQGAAVEIVSLETGRIRGWRLREWGDEIDVDIDNTAASPGRYDANAMARCREDRFQLLMHQVTGRGEEMERDVLGLVDQTHLDGLVKAKRLLEHGRLTHVLPDTQRLQRLHLSISEIERHRFLGLHHRSLSARICILTGTASYVNCCV